jgi:serine/threonine protein phosphatase 1
MSLNIIKKPTSGRRFVVGDIHGCIATFRKLILTEIVLHPQDHLYLLGDYVDRGPDSAAVLDFIMELQSHDYQVYALRGNHEQDILENWDYFGHTKVSHDTSVFVEMLTSNNAHGLLTSDGSLDPKYQQFMENLPYYFELEDYYLVHAGFNMEAAQPFYDYESMLWTRGFVKRSTPILGLGEKKVIVGHTVHFLDIIQDKISQNSQIIPLDNGCYYRFVLGDNPQVYDSKKLGNLCAFNLDTQDLTVVSCVD